MARFDQHMGLNEWAKRFTEGDPVILYHEESVRTYPDGRKEFLENRPILGSTMSTELSEQCYEGMFGDQYPLWRYQSLDGRIFEERIQADPWSSGPMFYVALVEIKDGQEEWVNESLWTEFLDETPEPSELASETEGEASGILGEEIGEDEEEIETRQIER